MASFVEQVAQAQGRTIDPTEPVAQSLDDTNPRTSDLGLALTTILVEAFGEALRRLVAANSKLEARVEGFESLVAETKGLMRQLDVHVRDVKDRSIDPVRLRELLFAKIDEFLPPRS